MSLTRQIRPLPDLITPRAWRVANRRRERRVKLADGRIPERYSGSRRG